MFTAALALLEWENVSVCSGISVFSTIHVGRAHAYMNVTQARGVEKLRAALSEKDDEVRRLLAAL